LVSELVHERDGWLQFIWIVVDVPNQSREWVSNGEVRKGGSVLVEEGSYMKRDIILSTVLCIGCAVGCAAGDDALEQNALATQDLSPLATNRKAAVVWRNDKIFFFTGSQYTRYDIAQDRADLGYPMLVASSWGNWPASWADGADAGLDWGNGKAYFFHDSQYLRYDIATDKVDAGYPKLIAGDWGSWPASWTSVDASVKWNNGK
jgi:hemopexin